MQLVLQNSKNAEDLEVTGSWEMVVFRVRGLDKGYLRDLSSDPSSHSMTLGNCWQESKFILWEE